MVSIAIWQARFGQENGRFWRFCLIFNGLCRFHPSAGGWEGANRPFGGAALPVPMGAWPLPRRVLPVRRGKWPVQTRQVTGRKGQTAPSQESRRRSPPEPSPVWGGNLMVGRRCCAASEDAPLLPWAGGARLLTSRVSDVSGMVAIRKDRLAGTLAPPANWG